MEMIGLKRKRKKLTRSNLNSLMELSAQPTFEADGVEGESLIKSEFNEASSQKEALEAANSPDEMDHTLQVVRGEAMDSFIWNWYHCSSWPRLVDLWKNARERHWLRGSSLIWNVKVVQSQARQSRRFP